jgi:hypothetical protein
MAHISPGLEELSCYITTELLDRLPALEVRTKHDDAEEAPRVSAVVAGAGRREQDQTKRRGSRLRKLNLYKSFWDTLDVSSGTRLLAWLAQPGSTPLLASVKLCEVFHGSTSSLADHAFRHFSLREGLEQLWLGKRPHYMHMIVSEAAINDVAPWACRDDCEAEYLYSDGRFKLVPRMRSKRRQPFQELRDVLVAVESEMSVTLLAPLLVSLTHLSLSVGHTDEQQVNDEEILRTLSTLQHLKSLNLLLVGRSAFAGASLANLRSLSQLQILKLDSSRPSVFRKTHLVALLASLRHLRSLRFHVDLRGPLNEVVNVIGETCPGLRCLYLRSPDFCNLATTLESRRHSPLFPHLEVLGLSVVATSPGNLRYVSLPYLFEDMENGCGYDSGYS